MLHKNLKLIFMGFAIIVALSVFSVQLFTKTDSASLKSPEQNTKTSALDKSNGKSAEKIPASVENFRKQMAMAQSNEELTNILRRLFAENEAFAIEAFALLDSNSSILADSYVITDFFREYFSERYTALEALKRISLWYEKKPVFFKYAGVDLLTRHSANDDPEQLIQFLNNKDYLEISTLVYEDVGYELGKGNPVAALNFVNRLDDRDAQNFFREGIFSRWMINDPDAVADYLNHHDLDISYDNILERFVERSENDLVAVYLEWTNLIKDPALRKNSQLSLARRWIQDTEFQEEYNAWKSSLTKTDADLLTSINQLENELAHRRQIKNDFDSLFSETKDAYAKNDIAGYETATNNIADKMQELMAQLESEPQNHVVQQELDIIYHRLSGDLRAGGSFTPSLESTLQKYADNHR